MGTPVNNILTKLLKGYLERHRKITEHFARLPWTGKKFEIYLSSGLVTSAFTCSQKMLLADVLASIAIRGQTLMDKVYSTCIFTFTTAKFTCPGQSDLGFFLPCFHEGNMRRLFKFHVTWPTASHTPSLFLSLLK